MRTLSLVMLAALAGCRTAAPGADSSGEALARELAGRTAGAPQACVSTFGNTNLRVIDSRTVAYEVGPTLWVNRLQDACPALSQFNTIIVETSAGQYCRGDRVRGAEPGAIIPGPACNLQDWVPHRRP